MANEEPITPFTVTKTQEQRTECNQKLIPSQHRWCPNVTYYHKLMASGKWGGESPTLVTFIRPYHPGTVTYELQRETSYWESTGIHCIEIRLTIKHESWVFFSHHAHAGSISWHNLVLLHIVLYSFWTTVVIWMHYTRAFSASFCHLACNLMFQNCS